MTAEKKITKELLQLQEAAGWARRREAGVPLDEEHFASDGMELTSTIGEAKKDFDALMRANANLMAPGVKQKSPDKTVEEIANAMYNGYVYQLERMGSVVAPDPFGLIRWSVRKED